MNLRQSFLANNECYIAGKTIIPAGIMLHSTGAPNPNLRRYVGPDDGLLGHNQFHNHWNVYHPEGRDIGPHAYTNDGKGRCLVCGGRQVCPHAFIGKLADGSIATYQTLPWDMRGWHAAGRANDSYIGIEVCEDGLTDAAYFEAVYREAAELCVYLCGLYGIKPEAPSLIDHSEGAALGIAGKHADVMHWWPKHGKDMGVFRADARKLLSAATPPPSPWAAEAWAWAKERGITDGTNPQGPCTREQVVTMLHRALGSL